MRGHTLSSLALVGTCGGLACSLVAGCGETRQDAHERPGRYTVQVVKQSFPAKQYIVHPTTLELAVRNTSGKRMPNVAVTLNSLDYIEKFDPKPSDPRRPIWAIDEGPGRRSQLPVETDSVDPPGGGQTVYVNTWALGPLEAGHTATFVWHLMPLKAGVHTVNYVVASGLSGKARAVLANGSEPRGHFTVDIASAPPKTSVDPKTGAVRPGVPPVSQVPVGPSP